MTTDARVHDIRYRRDDGERTGQHRATWALARWSALRAIGVGRDWRAKAGPILLLLGAFGPAIVVLGTRAILADQFGRDLPTDLISYGDYAGIVATVVFVFAALIGPRLMCEDRADRVLPLYFATAIGRWQYVGGKLLAAFLPMLLVTAVPVLVLFAGNVIFAEDPFDYLRDNAADIWRIALGGVLIAFFYACVSTAVASLSARQAPAIAGYAALMIGSGVLSGIVSNAIEDSEAISLLAVPVTLYEHTFERAFLGAPPPLGPSLLSYVVVVAGSVLVLALRYRRGT